MARLIAGEVLTWPDVEAQEAREIKVQLTNAFT